MKQRQACTMLLNAPERMNQLVLIHILMCPYPQSHSCESGPYLNQRYCVTKIELAMVLPKINYRMIFNGLAS